MTCQERWELIEPGAIVDFKDGHRVVKLAEQWDRYTGVNQYCVVGLNERDSDANGIIRHVSQYCDLHEPYKDQFRIAP